MCVPPHMAIIQHEFNARAAAMQSAISFNRPVNLEPPGSEQEATFAKMDAAALRVWAMGTPMNARVRKAYVSLSEGMAALGDRFDWGGIKTVIFHDKVTCIGRVTIADCPGTTCVYVDIEAYDTDIESDRRWVRDRRESMETNSWISLAFIFGMCVLSPF